jgi:hypothetical protein
VDRDQLARQCGQLVICCDALEQRFDLAQPLGGGQSELGGIAADRIGELRAIADQPIAQTDQHQRGLLLGGLDRDEAHRRPAHRLTQRFGIGRIVLAALDVRFDILRRDQPHFVSERLQETRPVVRSAARFDRHHCRRQPLEKRPHLPTP